MPRWSMMMLILGACAADDTLGDTDAVGPAEPDWTRELPGIYTAVESSQAIGTITTTFEVDYNPSEERYDVYFAPNGQRAYLKLYFNDVVPADRVGRAFVSIPEQIYAEGNTGPNDLELTGAGTVGPDGRDGRVNLDDEEIALEGTIGGELLTVTLTR